MAFEQSQRTRVESKQYSGDWSGFMAPSGGAGNVSTPFVDESEGIDFSPIGTVGSTIANAFEKDASDRAKAEKEQRERMSGEFLNRAYDIVELNTDPATGVLSAKGEEGMRNLRRQMGAAGYTDVDINRVMVDVGQDIKSTTLGLLQKAEREHTVETQKNLAKKGVEIYPELASAPMGVQAEAGANHYANMSAFSSAFEVAADPNVPEGVRKSALGEMAERLTGILGSENVRRWVSGNVTAQDQQDMADSIANAAVQLGFAKNVRQARAMGIEMAETFVGVQRKNIAEMEKFTIEEKQRFEDYKVYEARQKLTQAYPVLGFKAALTKYDFSKWPLDQLDMLLKFDYTKIAGDGKRHWWQGSFDSQTASQLIDNGTEPVADAALQATITEALKDYNEQRGQEVINALSSENLRGYLNSPNMPKEQRAMSVKSHQDNISSMMVNDLQSLVKQGTTYLPSRNKVVDADYWDTASKINPVLSKWYNAMERIGMTNEEIVETGKKAMKALGVAVPDNTLNPQAFFDESVKKIEDWGREHWFQAMTPYGAHKMDYATTGINNALDELKKGNISEEEFVGRVEASMKEINQGTEPTGIFNIDQATGAIEPSRAVETEGAPTIKTEGGVVSQRAGQYVLGDGTVDVGRITQDLLGSPRIKTEMEKISEDPTLSRNEKSVLMNENFQKYVSQFKDAVTSGGEAVLRGLQEAFGIKSANAAEGQMDMIPQAQQQAGEFVAHRLGKTKAANNITNIKAKNSHKFKSFDSVKECLAETGKDVEKKLERYAGDIFGLCNQYAPRSDKNLPSRYCAAILYRTPGVSDEDKQRLQEIVSDITNNYKEDGTVAMARRRDLAYEKEVKKISQKYKGLFYENRKPKMVGPIVSVIALMETGSKVDYVG